MLWHCMDFNGLWLTVRLSITSTSASAVSSCPIRFIHRATLLNTEGSPFPPGQTSQWPYVTQHQEMPPMGMSDADKPRAGQVHRGFLQKSDVTRELVIAVPMPMQEEKAGTSRVCCGGGEQHLQPTLESF